MTARIFVDTNVFVYARDASEARKHERAKQWLAHLWKSGSGRTGVQVLNEFYVTVTRKLKPGLPLETARKEVRTLLAWDPVPVEAGLVETAWTLQDDFGVAFWDAMVVAAARAAGCDHLLSEDLADGRDLGGVVVLDPFRHEPEGGAMEVHEGRR